MTRRTNTRGRNTAEQDRLLAEGEQAALSGVGLGDDLQDVLTAACGPYAIERRNAWLIGHTNGRRLMEAMAREACALAFQRAFTPGRRFYVERPEGARFFEVDVTDPATGLRFRCTVDSVQQCAKEAS